ncbi:ribonucleoside-diphosphate reductase subunit alpha [Virgibacillus flavescens]|uniref:ribonucleoside-diphosphate reductase subunit alpha n=1 Tax=Virgibacillus flavescens TaxID=1611422 RepID=UPI003D357792
MQTAMVKEDWKTRLENNVMSSFSEMSIQAFLDKNVQSKESLSTEDWVNQLTLEALANINEENPDWTYVAAMIYAEWLYQQAAENRGYDYENKYGSLYTLIEKVTEIGIYDKAILHSYTKKEIDYLGTVVNPDRDRLFTFIGLKTLADRYVAKGYTKQIFELPQERFMIIAMTLMQGEATENRLTLVEQAYWAMSNLYMTVATPTLANAGKSYGQLSSCFIDTLDDSLQSIYDSNTDIANLSKNGGGIGVYMGKIRSSGSMIKGFQGASSGVIPWMKQLNNTAVSVDQLGQRKGAICVYLDVWHKDIHSFLDSKLNNGDERMRTHDLFTGVTLPDLFMEKVEEREDWYLFDPHEVRSVMGYSLEDYYDEEKHTGSFRLKYAECVASDKLSKEAVPAIEIMKNIMKSQLETGGPFLFYRDEVNRQNVNNNTGMIYCSNLCTEIMQNQSPTMFIDQQTSDGKIMITKESGDFVVCNLSSINLGRAVKDNVLEELIPIQVRMLDNVIDLNHIPVPQAEYTNQRYRAIGLGTFGWHHLLAQKRIKWESQAAVDFADQLYEKIAYLTIGASMKLAKEKDAYPLFNGSEWETGKYFERKGYLSTDSEFSWNDLQRDVKRYGIRNSYLMAVAPNSSTSLIAGSSASIDPIFRKFYSEEKKDFKIPVTAPDLNSETTWYYKSAYLIDQKWSVAQNAVRQKHIDQGISFNIYVPNGVQARELLDIHVQAWKSGFKTTYYLRSTSTDIEECESCSS